MNTAGLGTQPNAGTYELDELVLRAWAGQVRVPHFQRGFRWGAEDVLRLFDSIVRGYPIGSLLLWVRNSPAQAMTLGSLVIQAPESENAWWVVDGQQRITSLANALHPEGNLHAPFNVFYDLAREEFISKPAHPEAHQIPAPVLFDLDKMLEYFDGTGRPAKEYFPAARQVAKSLRQFKIPVYLVKQEDQDVLTDIFDRMNNFGKRLSRAEIFSALFAGSEEGADDRLKISTIAARVDAQTGFGPIDDDTVLHAILARRGPDPSREIRLEFDDERRRTKSDFPGEDRDTLVSTVVYAPADEPEDMGLKLGGSRRFDTVTRRTFTELEARLTRRLGTVGIDLADVAATTVRDIRTAWPECSGLVADVPWLRQGVGEWIESRSRGFLGPA